MQRILLLFFIFTFIISGQFKRNKTIFEQPSDIYFEFLNIDSDSSNLVLLFKTTYDRLIFAKNDILFQSGLTLNIEFRDSSEFILRKSKKFILNILDFALTNSRNNFLEGIFQLKIPEGKYNTFISVEFENSSKVLNLPEKIIEVKSNKYLSQPIITYSTSPNIKEHQVINFGGDVLFSEKALDLFVPVIKQNPDSSLNVKLIQNNKISAVFSIIEKPKIYAIVSRPNGIFLIPNSNGLKYFRISNFNPKLNEGPLRIEVESFNSKINYEKNVKWFSKPLSLSDPEYAIEQIKLIDSEKLVDSLLEMHDDDYLLTLNNYWRKFDTDTSTQFNDSMKEFYLRVDYADNNFSMFDKKKGSKTDRGKVYIKFGAPEDIKRIYNKLDSVEEIWIYKNLNMKFKFVDSSGLGNYLLVR